MSSRSPCPTSRRSKESQPHFELRKNESKLAAWDFVFENDTGEFEDKFRFGGSVPTEEEPGTRIIIPACKNCVLLRSNRTNKRVSGQGDSCGVRSNTAFFFSILHLTMSKSGCEKICYTLDLLDIHEEREAGVKMYQQAIVDQFKRNDIFFIARFFSLEGGLVIRPDDFYIYILIEIVGEGVRRTELQKGVHVRTVECRPVTNTSARDDGSTTGKGGIEELRKTLHCRENYFFFGYSIEFKVYYPKSKVKFGMHVELKTKKMDSVGEAVKRYISEQSIHEPDPKFDPVIEEHKQQLKWRICQALSDPVEHPGDNHGRNRSQDWCHHWNGRNSSQLGLDHPHSQEHFTPSGLLVPPTSITGRSTTTSERSTSTSRRSVSTGRRSVSTGRRSAYTGGRSASTDRYSTSNGRRSTSSTSIQLVSYKPGVYSPSKVPLPPSLDGSPRSGRSPSPRPAPIHGLPGNSYYVRDHQRPPRPDPIEGIESGCHCVIS